MTRTLQGYYGVSRIEDAKVVVFTGGADINPKLYEQDPIPGTYFNDDRDKLDLEAYNRTTEDQVLVGICRGAQFLNVMKGGTLWQDVDNHRHSHSITDRMTGSSIWATSTHHQAMIPNLVNCRVVATAHESRKKKNQRREWSQITPGIQFNGLVKLDGDRCDYEVIEYDNRVLCFQPHPEINSASQALRQFFFNRLGILLTNVRKS
jgi:gamma-glutamyl-gamma-aminobutyrate hydrolase PuuD